ncbi:MAG: hypothetical protein RQ826_17540 [Xanthomonadales bacterium]|nr:hypothetical protein [Xanthomonadales bacterium]
MNYRTFFTRAMALAAVVVLAGCAARTDCTQALELADEAARGQQPPGAWIDRVDAACSDAAMERWTSGVAGQCAPVFGFHAALSGAERPEACAGAGFDSAWNLGEMIAGMRNEVEEIERRLADDSISPETRRDLEQRRMVIGRDLPQIEALARMDGYLPPAEVPDSD